MFLQLHASTADSNSYNLKNGRTVHMYTLHVIFLNFKGVLTLQRIRVFGHQFLCLIAIVIKSAIQIHDILYTVSIVHTTELNHVVIGLTHQELRSSSSPPGLLRYHSEGLAL